MYASGPEQISRTRSDTSRARQCGLARAIWATTVSPSHRMGSRVAVGKPSSPRDTNCAEAIADTIARICDSSVTLLNGGTYILPGYSRPGLQARHLSTRMAITGPSSENT